MEGCKCDDYALRRKNSGRLFKPLQSPLKQLDNPEATINLSAISLTTAAIGHPSARANFLRIPSYGGHFSICILNNHLRTLIFLPAGPALEFPASTFTAKDRQTRSEKVSRRLVYFSEPPVALGQIKIAPRADVDFGVDLKGQRSVIRNQEEIQYPG
ncbi:hypothetical protein KM043_006856 [Ampulex compressa]|nr:hypothetical protein KM043_006856 [Ampulex compressa]